MSATTASTSPDAEQALRRLRAMLANISDTVTLVDADGHVLDTTGLHSSVMGYEPEFWRGRSLFDLIDPADVGRLSETRELVLRRPGEQVTVDVRLRQADGSWADVEMTAVNLLHDPDVAGIVITSRNITARKSIEAELAARRDEALEESRLRSELVARVSHELRNQLHALRGLTELLATAELPRSAQHLTATTQRHAEQFQHLVDELLEYGRTDAERNPLRPVPTLVRQLVADAVTLASELSADGVEVRSSTAEDVPDSVSIDAPKVRQVLANLVGNAAKFTARGSIVIEVELCTRGDCAGLHWTITDTGPGIPEEDHARIFQPFERGSRGDAGGVGLGLAISSRLVELMGGRLRLESAAGHGSSFHLELPYELAEEDLDEAALSPVRVRDRAHVLVVEDNVVNQMLVAEQLGRLGARATVVGSGAQALELLAEPNDISCVLMDWQLPGLDGVETTRLLRRAEVPTDRRPVVGMTASARPSDREICLGAGMDELLVKPVGMFELGEALRPYIGERRAHDRTAAQGRLAADTSALDRLADQLGSIAPVRSIVSTYLVELDRREESVRLALEDGDADLLRRTAHTLRSTSRTLGAADLDSISLELERHEFPPGPELVDRFTLAARCSRDALEAWLVRTADASE